MVSSKFHARSTGPVQSTTRQPVEGRSKDGGLRFGEMEVWTLIDHGAAEVLKDRIVDQSDLYHIVYCEACGCLAEEAPPQSVCGKKPGAYQLRRGGLPYCRHCKRSDTVREAHIPYAKKLLMQELGGLCLGTRFSKDPNPHFVV